MNSVVDPRTIVVNALTHLRTSPDWQRYPYGWRSDSGISIAVDDRGIHVVGADGSCHVLDLWCHDEEPVLTAARAVDVACAKGIFPLDLSVGWQAHATATARRVAALAYGLDEAWAQVATLEDELRKSENRYKRMRNELHKAVWERNALARAQAERVVA